MNYNYDENTFQYTQELIQAVIEGNIEQARSAIQRGANVNCRIIYKNGRYEIASPAELSTVLRGSKSPETGDMPSHEEPVLYEVPMVNTTTLLNLLATRQAAPKDPEHCAMSALLMDNKAELGAIDFKSYWTDWSSNPANYFQNTPLLNAIACENLAFATLYMQYVNKLDEQPRKELLNYKDKFIAGFHTALEFAIRRGYSGLATSIVKAGADTNPQPFVYAYAGKSPLHMACMLCGNSMRNKDEWDAQLGSDVDLIIALLEHGADHTLLVETVVYTIINIGPLGLSQERKKVQLTALDHLAFFGDPGFNYQQACISPAFRPGLNGQIKHPFHDETSFLSDLALTGIKLGSRARYLSSKLYLDNDLRRIQEAYFFAESLMRSRGTYRSQLEPIPPEINPLFNPQYRNKITYCSSNLYESSESKPQQKPHQSDKKEKDISDSFSKIENELTRLRAKIDKVDKHRSHDAFEAATKLLSQLEEAQVEHRKNLQKPEVNVTDINKLFILQCKMAINTAKPLLEKDLGWGSYLTNLLKKLANAVISRWTTNPNALFKLEKSESAQATEQFENGLLPP